MHRYARWFVDDYQVIVFVDYAYRLRCHGRLVSVKGMRYHISILDCGVW
jgi:hypothetical protein